MERGENEKEEEEKDTFSILSVLEYNYNLNRVSRSLAKTGFIIYFISMFVIEDACGGPSPMVLYSVFVLSPRESNAIRY